MASYRRNPRFKAEMARPENNRKWVYETARTGRDAIQAAAPRATGFLTSRVDAEASPSNPTVRFRVDVGQPPYGLFQEVGTGLYGPLKRYITPKRAKMLSWISDTGERVYAKRVRGTRPKRYIREAFWAVFGRQRVRYYGREGGRGNRFG
ncbi:MAG: hypothetical protein ACOYOQ_00020 [Microthrixaceae bacterium]